jgi:hypothetical protein
VVLKKENQILNTSINDKKFLGGGQTLFLTSKCVFTTYCIFGMKQNVVIIAVKIQQKSNA